MQLAVYKGEAFMIDLFVRPPELCVHLAAHSASSARRACSSDFQIWPEKNEQITCQEIYLPILQVRRLIRLKRLRTIAEFSEDIRCYRVLASNYRFADQAAKTRVIVKRERLVAVLCSAPI